MDLNGTTNNLFERSKEIVRRVLRALRGKISLCMFLNDLGMLYGDEPKY
jgi:hypothetical protein